MARTITERGLKEFLSLTRSSVLERQGLAITHSEATWLAARSRRSPDVWVVELARQPDGQRVGCERKAHVPRGLRKALGGRENFWEL
jgi:hypothetical protein